MAPSVLDRPTVLLVGSGERMQAALEAALDRHGLLVETSSAESGAGAVFAAAPDLVVLLGDATNDGGRALLGRLGENSATAMVPVLLLADGAGLDQRLDAFRHGVVAVVPKSASADGMARRIAELARELPERSGETTGELGETSVEELVNLFSQQLRSGILSVTAGDDAEAAQVVVRAGRPVTEAIEELVQRLRPLIQRSSGSLRYEFHESPAARIGLFDDDVELGSPVDLTGRRIVVVEQNPARADVLVQELRAHGARVVVADGEGRGLDRARAHDPEIVILDGSGMEGWALPALRELRRDVRLRWGSLLLVDGTQLWVGDGTSAESLARLLRSIPPLVRPDLELMDRARREFEFDTRLELVGPSRMLRALAATGMGLRASIVHPRARVEVDFAEGLLAGARLSAPGSGRQLAEGPVALAGLLVLASGRVRIARKDAPASANVMAPIDDALAQAAREKSPLRASVRPPAGGELPVPVPKPNEKPNVRAKDKTPRDSEQLLARLETLLGKLQEVLPAATAGRPPWEQALPPPPALPSLAGGPPALPERADPTKRAKRSARPPGAPPSGEGSLSSSTVELTSGELQSTELASAELGSAELNNPEVATAEMASPEFAPWESAPVPSPVAEQSTRPPPPDAHAATLAEGSVRPPPPDAHAATLSEGSVRPPPPAVSREPLAYATTLAEGSVRPPPPSDPAVGAPPVSREPLAYATTLAEGSVRPPPPPAQSEVELRPRRLPIAAIAAGCGAALVLGLVAIAVAFFVLQDDDSAPVAAVDVPEPPTVRDTPSTAHLLLPSAEPEREAAPEPPEPPPERESEAAPEVVDAPAEEPAAPERAGEGDEGQDSELRRVIRTANFQRNNGQFREAEANYQRALRLERRNPRALAGLTRLYIDRREGRQAVRWARILTASNPRSAGNQVLLGEALDAAGNRPAATRAYREALRIAPNHREARRRLDSSR